MRMLVWSSDLNKYPEAQIDLILQMAKQGVRFPLLFYGVSISFGHSACIFISKDDNSGMFKLKKD